jgi:hypothetical protein
MNERASDIRYLFRNEIDIHKWDHCIRNAPNGLIYARSFYLDSMAGNWSALVLNDYEAVMPLTWKRKFGISYLYQPAFTAQLGVFTKNLQDKLMLNKFIRQAELHFRFCEIHLNFTNPVIEKSMRANYILALGIPYTEIRKGYKKRLLENLQEAESYHLVYRPAEDYRAIIRLFQNQYGKRFSHVRPADYRNFEILCGELLNRKMIFGREVKNQTGDLLSASIFFRDEHRIYNIMSVTLQPGRDQRAHFHLLDQLILEFNSNDIILDFEGSDVAGIAEFYRKFGSVYQPYPFLKFNHLPFPLRLFK